jgi:hypothetical protein
MIASNQQAYDIKCDHCGVVYSILADRQDIFDWLAGDKYIQDALYYLSPAERELLISRTCDSCFNSFFPVDNEE